MSAWHTSAACAGCDTDRMSRGERLTAEDTEWRAKVAHFICHHMDSSASQLPIESMPVSQRTRNALLRSGMRQVGDVLSASLWDLRDVRYLGDRGIAEISSFVTGISA